MEGEEYHLRGAHPLNEVIHPGTAVRLIANRNREVYSIIWE